MYFIEYYSTSKYILKVGIFKVHGPNFRLTKKVSSLYTKRPVYAVPPNPFEKNHFLSDLTTTINKLLFEWSITICKAP